MIKFILQEMTFLKYFMPVVIEANRRGIKTQMLVGSNVKYTNPQRFIKRLAQIENEYKVSMVPLNDESLAEGIFITVEGVMSDRIPRSNKVVSLTAFTDFSLLYDKYIENVDYVVFPNKFLADFYNKLSPKNIYVGSPVFDIEIDPDEVKKKYEIKADKNVLLLFPRFKSMHLLDIKKIYGYLDQMGYSVLLKARGKEPVPDDLRHGRYFEDEAWYPHPTMELMEVADFVINTDSTAIMECIMSKTPLINFHLKPFVPLESLYNYKYCEQVNHGVSFDDFQAIVEKLLSRKLSKEFDKARKRYLFKAGGVSGKILDCVM